MPDVFIASPDNRNAQVLPNPSPESELERIKRDRVAHPLSAFISAPKNWSFETQEKDEEIILILRNHWITNIGWVALSVLLTVLPGFLLILLPFGFLPLRFKVMAILLWYLFLGGFIFQHFLGWFFNVFIITDERIIDFDFYGLIYKEISDAKTEDIQDVTYRVGGFLRNLFNFGDVFIQTAAEQARFEFYNVPDPGRVAKILRELISEEEIEKLEGRAR
ncbi:MAG TPA: PH domain-containing protein [Candidatus Bathyarchaeia archaeon]|nr:PH domain-containing protein [Candidatus Bathyarchaeia archaeon]